VTLRGAGYGAFRAPTLNELYRQFRVGNVATSPNPDLIEERLWGAEAGGGWSGPIGASSATLSVDGTFYWNNLDDAIINATVSVSPTFIRRRRENLGAATARGVEINGRLDFAERWTISAAYARLDSFIREAIPGTDPATTVGNRLPQVPTYRARATVWYRSAPGWAGSLSVGAMGEQFEDDLNLLPLAAAVLVDAAFEIPIIDAAQFTIRVQNMFDEAVAIRRAPVLAYGAPRLVYAGFTLTFPD
jgi:outer membrane receptor protein involved in Fe transport